MKDLFPHYSQITLFQAGTEECIEDGSVLLFKVHQESLIQFFFLHIGDKPIITTVAMTLLLHLVQV